MAKTNLQKHIYTTDSGYYRTVGIKWSLGAGGISIYDPSGGNDVFVAASLSEQWQHYELIVNTNTQTVSLSVDSATPVVTTYTPNTGGTFDGTPDAVEIYGSNKYLDWYALDNLRLEVTGSAALLGDANQDSVVSADDYASVQANFGSTGAAGGGLLGDANHDGAVSADDYASVQANFGNTSGGMSAVPEPATLGLLAIGLIAVLRRRTK